MTGRQTRAGFVSWMGGCFACHGGECVWSGKNAQAVAARHHDATGHTTWFEGVFSVRYGEGGGATASRSTSSEVAHD